MDRSRIDDRSPRPSILEDDGERDHRGGYPWLVPRDPDRVSAAGWPADGRRRRRLALMVASSVLLVAVVLIVVLPALGGPRL